MNEWIALVAQSPSPAPQQPGGAAFFPIALMLGLVAFMLLSARSQKKREHRQRNEMFERMAKNDRVLTIGGVIGTVVQIKDDEVVLKIDETTGTKMTFLKSAIQKILTDAPAA